MSKARVIGYRKPIHRLKNKQLGLDSMYTNGANNLYPTYVDNSISGSATAKRAHNYNKDYIVGEFDFDDYLINKGKELYISNIFDSAASDLSSQGGFFIHINIEWDENKFKPVDPSIIPYSHARVNKEDDKDNISKIFVSSHFTTLERILFEKDKIDWYYKYTSKQSAILYQIEDWAKKNEIDYDTEEGKLEAIQSFPGQVRFVKYTNEFPYPTSPVDTVLIDAESEFYISKYTNEQTVNGFMGKVIVFVVEEDSQGDEVTVEHELENWLGTDGSGGVFVQPMKNTDDPSKLIHVESIKSNFDDKLFDVTNKRIRANILGLFDNLPEGLVFGGEGALFGQHPDLLQNLKQMYFENTDKKRKFLYRTLNETLGLDATFKEMIDGKY